MFETNDKTPVFSQWCPESCTVIYDTQLGVYRIFHHGKVILDDPYFMSYKRAQRYVVNCLRWL